jgi:hypothetical protein
VVFVQKKYSTREVMKPIKYTVLIILILILGGSCHKIQMLPDEPYIKFSSFAVFDSTDILGNYCKGGRLKFYFEDGDGDLGLDVAEAGVADTTNLFFTLYKKTDGVMVQVSDSGDLLKPSNYRIPYMERTGRNKILKGTISVTFLYTFYESRDSILIKYNFYIKDREEHYSDTVSTSEIPLSVNGLYI